MIRPSCVAALSLLLAAGCTQPEPALRPKLVLAPPVQYASPASQAPFRGYRLAASYVEKGPFRDGAPLRVGAIVNGLRVRTDANGLSLADSVTVAPLQGGAQLPDWLGGGLLFWNSSALYTAETFLGSLNPLIDVGFRPLRVSFGPSFVLVRGSDGQRIAVDLRARQRVPIAPALLVDIAASADGRAVALLEGGHCQSSTDAGKTYQALPLPPGAQAVGVREESGSLLVSLSTTEQIRLELGKPARLEGAPRPAAVRAAADALWPLKEPPLERALAFGARIGDEFAGVAVAGSIATVNLRTGELVQMTRALVPSDLSCRTLNANGALLLACRSREQGSVVLAHPFGERPVIEAKFPKDVALSFADGILVSAARCDGSLGPGLVCVRGADGHFHDFDSSAQLGALEKAGASPKPGGKPVPLTISRWVPKVGGGAVAIVAAPTPGMIDAQTGAFVAFSKDVPSAVYQYSRSMEDWLGLSWVAMRDGSVRGWLPQRGVAIGKDGQLEPSVFEFHAVAGAGAQALAFDRGRHVFQTADWGRNWVETLAPPGSASGASGGKPMQAPKCSQVGCLLGPWLRVGWDAEVPAAVSRPQIAATPPSVLREPLPVLSCKQLAAAHIEQQPPPNSDPDPAWHGSELGVSAASKTLPGDDQSSFYWSTVHPVTDMGPTLGLRASLQVRLPVQPQDQPPPSSTWPGYAVRKRIAYVPSFEPRGRVQSSSITFRALFDAASSAGAAYPSLDSGAGQAYRGIPVLGLKAGEADGLILDDGTPLWVRASADASALAIEQRDGDPQLISALVTAPNVLAVLSAGDDGSLEVLEFARGKGRRLFRHAGLGAAFYPANADALAVAADGALAILRSPSGSEPATGADPAMLFHADGSVSTVAPWSRLFLADAPECKPAMGDYRAILQTSRAWLHLVDGGVPVSDEALQAGMFAALRFNADRLCLEAVELAAAPADRADSAHETRLAARFVGAGRGAARLAFARGFELHQELACSLSVAR